jgi:hypothetical protein
LFAIDWLLIGLMLRFLPLVENPIWSQVEVVGWFKMALPLSGEGRTLLLGGRSGPRGAPVVEPTTPVVPLCGAELSAADVAIFSVWARSWRSLVPKASASVLFYASSGEFVGDGEGQ